MDYVFTMESYGLRLSLWLHSTPQWWLNSKWDDVSISMLVQNCKTYVTTLLTHRTHISLLCVYNVVSWNSKLWHGYTLTLTHWGLIKTAVIFFTHFQILFFQWNFCIKDWMNFISKHMIFNKSALVQVMAWHQGGAKPLLEPNDDLVQRCGYALLGLRELTQWYEINS